MSSFKVKVYKQEPFKEFRPLSHDFLQRKDDNFDLNYDALLVSVRIIQDQVINHISSLGLHTRTELSESLHRNDQESMVEVVFIPSKLSDYDRAMIVPTSIEAAISGHPILMMQVNRNQLSLITSLDRLIRVIVEQLLLQQDIVNILKGFSVKETSALDSLNLDSGYIAQHSAELFDTILDVLLPDNSDISLQDTAKSKYLKAMIFINFLEGVSSGVFEQFIKLLASKQRAFTLVACCSTDRIALYENGRELAQYASCRRIDTVSPSELCDTTMQLLLAKSNLSVSIPSSVLLLLHQEFEEYEGCVSTLLQRVKAMLRQHFHHRRSLLCMAHDTQWSRFMNIATTKTSNVLEAIVENIGMTADNIPFMTGKGKAALTNLQLSLDAAWDHRCFCRIHAELACILAKRLFSIEDQHSRFSVLQTWAIVLSASETNRTNDLASLFANINSGLKMIKVFELQDMLQLLRRVVSAKRHDDRDMQTSTYQERRVQLTQRINRMLKMIRKFSRDFSTADFALSNHSQQSLKERLSSIATSSDIPTISVKLTESDINSSPALLSLVQKLPEAPTELPLDVLTVFNFALTSLSTIIKSIFTDFAKIPYAMRGMDGTLVVDAAAAGDLFKGNLQPNLRLTLYDSLKGPPHHKAGKKGASSSSSSKNKPDVCHLHDCVMSKFTTENAACWFESFLIGIDKRKAEDREEENEGNDDDDDDDDQKEAKKPRLSTNGDKQELKALYSDRKLRCRFINALYSLERSGVISTTSGDNKQTVKIHKQWA